MLTNGSRWDTFSPPQWSMMSPPLTGRAAGEAPEIGVVRVFSNPGPDAEDRLRRLLSLMVRYATRDGQAGKEQDSPSDPQPTDDPAEEEA